MSKETFIEKARRVHGDKYDYSKVSYSNCKDKVCIICPEHGEFWQTPDNHLQKKGCPVCRYISSGDKRRTSISDFINKANAVHNNKYDYSKANYITNRIKICITCPEHGDFWQTPDGHINKQAGCPYCSNNHKYSTEEFIEKAKIVWGDQYDFSQVEYNGTHNKVKVICRKHGEFWQTPHNLLIGVGCKFCNESKLERYIRQFLESQNIEYIYEYSRKELKRQTIDFYLPKYNIGIECQGRQHFEPVDFKGSDDSNLEEILRHVKELDETKFHIAKQLGIKMVYYIDRKNEQKFSLDDFYKESVVINEPFDLLKVLKHQ